MVPALKAVMSGRHFASPTPLAALRDNYALFSQEQPQNVALTRMEADVLRLTVRGKSDKEMARALNITVRAVEKRKARLRKKFGVTSTVELAVVAATQRLMDSEDGHDLPPLETPQGGLSATI
jgi:DNA-binding NarL/FixJ family response regulator